MAKEDHGLWVDLPNDSVKPRARGPEKNRASSAQVTIFHRTGAKERRLASEAPYCVHGIPEREGRDFDDV
jgi:hypothetical protein